MRTLLNRLLGDERGGAIAEFMLGLIPLVIAFALVFEFGTASGRSGAIKGVRDATRYLTRVEDPNDPGAQAVAQNLLLTGQQASGGTARWSSGSAPPMEVVVEQSRTAARPRPRQHPDRQRRRQRRAPAPAQQPLHSVRRLGARRRHLRGERQRRHYGK